MMGHPGEQMVQLAYVVEDMDTALQHCTQAVGAGPFFRMAIEVPDGVYRGQRGPIVYEAAFGYHGPMNIELIAQSNRIPSVYRETLDHTGPGFHHFMIRTDDYDRTLERYSDMGMKAAFEAELPGSGRWAYLDARAQIGSFIELYDMQPAVARMWASMEAAHRTWDGQKPVRSITDLG